VNLTGNSEPYDRDGHGTGCTGIAVGTKGYGVAPEANFMRLQVLLLLLLHVSNVWNYWFFNLQIQ
jgi:subtilisin family serine protease